MNFRKAYLLKSLLTFCTVVFLLLSLLATGFFSWLLFFFAVIAGAAMLVVNFKYWKCPECGKNLGGSKPIYCPHCSERLDWHR